MNIRCNEARVTLRGVSGVSDGLVTLFLRVVNNQAERRQERNRYQFEQPHTQAKIESESHV